MFVFICVCVNAYTYQGIHHPRRQTVSRTESDICLSIRIFL